MERRPAGWRRERGISVAQLSARSGLSVSAIKSYENGTRHPSQSALGSIISALGNPREEANRILAGAGYAVDWYALLNERYTSDLPWLEEAVDRAPWPVFITNQAIDLVYANRAFEATWDVDLATELREPGDRNFLARASDPRFADCFENYDEVVTFMIGLAKGDPVGSSKTLSGWRRGCRRQLNACYRAIPPISDASLSSGRRRHRSHIVRVTRTTSVGDTGAARR